METRGFSQHTLARGGGPYGSTVCRDRLPPSSVGDRAAIGGRRPARPASHRERPLRAVRGDGPVRGGAAGRDRGDLWLGFGRAAAPRPRRDGASGEPERVDMGGPWGQE